MVRAILTSASRGTRVRRSRRSSYLWDHLGDDTAYRLALSLAGWRGLIGCEVEPTLVEEHHLEDGLGERLAPSRVAPTNSLPSTQRWPPHRSHHLQLPRSPGLGKKAEHVVQREDGERTNERCSGNFACGRLGHLAPPI